MKAEASYSQLLEDESNDSQEMISQNGTGRKHKWPVLLVLALSLCLNVVLATCIGQRPTVRTRQLRPGDHISMLTLPF